MENENEFQDSPTPDTEETPTPPEVNQELVEKNKKLFERAKQAELQAKELREKLSNGLEKLS